MNKAFAAFLAFSFFISHTAQAHEYINGVDIKYFDISKSPTIEQVPDAKYKNEPGPRALSTSQAIQIDGCEDEAKAGVRQLSEDVDPISKAEVMLDQILNMGKKVWNVVQSGKPVTSVKLNAGTALPKGIRCWIHLQNWSRPVSKVWKVSYKNGFGTEVVSFTYRVLYIAGGNVDGIGKYIGYAAIEPAEINVAWGYTFNVEASVPTVFNMGDSQNPVAGMQLQLNYKIDTVVKHIQQTQAFFLDGNGVLEKLP